jgi:hypothetical protein
LQLSLAIAQKVEKVFDNLIDENLSFKRRHVSACVCDFEHV